MDLRIHHSISDPFDFFTTAPQPKKIKKKERKKEKKKLKIKSTEAPKTTKKSFSSNVFEILGNFSPAASLIPSEK